MRNPSKHKTLDDNYIKDWIQLANLQLFTSGARFGLDVEKINYVLVKNTFLNTLECDATTGLAEWVADRMKDPAPDNPYRDSVILLYRWGSDPNKPTGQSCSGVDSPLLLLNRYREDPMMYDGQAYGLGGDDQLTHEFGHFMGLEHTFPNVALDLANLADLDGRNPLNLSLIEPNLPKMPGVTKDDLKEAKQKAISLIGDWKYDFDQDDFGRDVDPKIPNDYAITDTPIDLLLGLPLIFGYNACSGFEDISIKIDDGRQLTFPMNETVRGNIMSYWACNPSGQFFSNDQVARMGYVLKTYRSNLIGRTVTVNLSCGLLPPLKTYIPLDPLKARVPFWETPFWETIPVQAKRDPHLVEELKFIDNTVPAYKPWDPQQLQIHLRTLERSGRLAHIQSATSEVIERFEKRQTIHT